MFELLNGERWPQWVPIPIRMILGVGFIAHGWAKWIRGPAAFTELLKQAHVPLPLANAWLVTLLEIFGGVALLLGEFVTIVSVPPILSMLGAMFTVNIKYGFSAVNTIGLTPDGTPIRSAWLRNQPAVHCRSGGADPQRRGPFVNRCTAKAPTAAAFASSRLIKLPQGSSRLPLCGLQHQCDEPAAAGDFELTKNCVKMLFHHRQT